MNQTYVLIFFLFLFAPIFVFYEIFKKHWADKTLKKTFWIAVPAGVGAVFLTRFAYLLVEFFLGYDLRSFLSGNHSWQYLLMASICVVGLIEEFIKTAVGMVVATLVDSERGSTVIFISLVGCALGFSLIENYHYYTNFGASVVVPRVLISATAHLFFAAVCSVIIAKAYAKKRSDCKISLRIIAGILVASVIHGLFNFMVFYYEIVALNGIMLSIMFVFLLGIYEAWISVMKMDEQKVLCLTGCPGCGSIAFHRSRFCSLCGSRVNVLRKTGMIVEEKKDN